MKLIVINSNCIKTNAVKRHHKTGGNFAKPDHASGDYRRMKSVIPMSLAQLKYHITCSKYYCWSYISVYLSLCKHTSNYGQVDALTMLEIPFTWERRSLVSILKVR